VQTHNADDVLVSAGFPIGSKIATFMVGALTGGVVVYLIHKQKIDTLNDEIASLKMTMKNAEESIKKIEKKTETLSNPMTFEQSLMRNFNQMNGY
jgi:galactokinase